MSATGGCSAPNICIGTSCAFNLSTVAPDGTPFVSGDTRTTGGVACRPSPWPASDCAETLIPTRMALVRDASSDHAYYGLGYGSRMANMLAVSAHALLHGYGFQLSSHACAYEDRWRPHCFFQPVSACGRHATHVCTDTGPGTVPAGSDLGNCNTLTAKQRAAFPALFHLPSWGRLTGANMSRICRLLLQRAKRLPPQPDEPRQPPLPDASACDERQTWSRSGAPARGGLLAYRLLARTVLRLQPEVQASIDAGLKARFPWLHDGAPFGAVHIRRRDKTSVQGRGREARSVPVCAYAQRLAVLSRARSRLRVFVATDDFRTLDVFRRCDDASRLGWLVGAWPDGEPARGVNASVVHRLWSEMLLLTKATWAVATFTSNVGRLVQLLRTQPPGTLWSVDTAQRFAIPPDRPFVFANATAGKQELVATRLHQPARS